MVKVFDASDNARDILDEVLENGIAGISGGRVGTRRKLREVAGLAEEEGHESIRATSTINHPETELAFPYDDSQYELQEAKAMVERAYAVKSS